MIRAISPLDAVAIAAIALLMSGVDQYLFVAIGLPPLIIQVATLGILLLSLVVSSIAGRKVRVIRPQMICLIIIYLYVFWTALSFLYATPSEIVVEVLIGRIKAMVFLIVCAFIFMRSEIRTGFAYACIGLIAMAVALNVFDFVTPTFSVVPGRSAGFYLNPNISASALGILPMMSASAVPSMVNFILIGMSAIGLALTFSRSGWLIFLLGGLGLAVLGRLGGGRARFVFLAVLAFVFTAIFYSYWSGSLYLYLSSSSIGEFLDPNTLARLGSRGVELDDYSSQERSDVAAMGLDTFLASPLLGQGVGYTYIWGDRTSTHNMVLLLGAELGLPGIILYLALFGMLIAKSRGVPRLMAVMLLADGIFTHNQFDFISAVIPIAFVLASLGDGMQTALPSRAVVRRTRQPKPRGS